jgi:hypothetical protein
MREKKARKRKKLAHERRLGRAQVAPGSVVVEPREREREDVLEEPAAEHEINAREETYEVAAIAPPLGMTPVEPDERGNDELFDK